MFHRLGTSSNGGGGGGGGGGSGSGSGSGSDSGNGSGSDDKSNNGRKGQHWRDQDDDDDKQEAKDKYLLPQSLRRRRRWTCCLSGWMHMEMTMVQLPLLLPSPSPSPLTARDCDQDDDCNYCDCEYHCDYDDRDESAAVATLETLKTTTVTTTSRTGTSKHMTTASELEQVLDRYLSYPAPLCDDDHDEDDDYYDYGEKAAAEVKGGEKDPVAVFLSADAHLLNCRRIYPPAAVLHAGTVAADANADADANAETPMLSPSLSEPTVFGFLENARLYRLAGDDKNTLDADVRVEVSLHRPKPIPDPDNDDDDVDDDDDDDDDDDNDNDTNDEKEVGGGVKNGDGDGDGDGDNDGKDGIRRGCGCTHPRGDWSPLPENSRDDNDDHDDDVDRASSAPLAAARLRIVDLTELQAHRRRRRRRPRARARARARNCNRVKEMLTFDSCKGACHLLRSVLRCIHDKHDGDSDSHGSGVACSYSTHCASPWSRRYENNIDNVAFGPSATTNSATKTTVCAARNAKTERNVHRHKHWRHPPSCQYRDVAIGILVRGHACASSSSSSSKQDGTSVEEMGQHRHVKNICVMQQEEYKHEQDFDELERNELWSLLSFRTGDASPSYYLHSAARLTLPPPPSVYRRSRCDDSGDNGNSEAKGQGRNKEHAKMNLLQSILLSASASTSKTAYKKEREEEEEEEDEKGNDNNDDDDDDDDDTREEFNDARCTKATLLVYRHLPPRDSLTVRHPLAGIGIGDDCGGGGGRGGRGGRGDGDKSGTNTKSSREENDPRRRWHCRWEAYVPPPPTTPFLPKEEKKGGEGEEYDKNGEEIANSYRAPPQSRPDDDDANDAVPEKCAPAIRYRLVAPPYQCHSQLYPSVLDELLLPSNLSVVIREAMSIPRWTAWPETTHYSNGGGGNDTGEGMEGGGNGNATWTVFPLCHTFPADDVTKRTWIDSTCRYVPKTASLLRRGALGRTVRTALFSRLAPGTNLGAHTGWADLANHVFRVHIPLVVPGYGGDDDDDDPRDVGMCGTWVDGCIETHVVGEPIVFDDSKVHRAFNYSGKDRVVLIIDLARPADLLPGGTATGGHTEELDRFIQELT